MTQELTIKQLTEDHGYSFDHSPEDDELTITQATFYEGELGDQKFAIAIAQLNEMNVWDDAGFDRVREHIEAALSRPAPDMAAVVEALEWYGEQARLCRLIHGGGDEGRHNLQADGGNKARAALQSLRGEP